MSEIDTRDLIARSLNLAWDERISKQLGAQAFDMFGIIGDSEAHDEEIEYGFVFFPGGRQNTRTCVIIEIGSYDRMDNILTELAEKGALTLPPALHQLFPDGCIKLPS